MGHYLENHESNCRTLTLTLMLRLQVIFSAKHVKKEGQSMDKALNLIE